jgi:DNA-binding response OmpR family regulator
MSEKPKILIIDDDPGVLRLLVELLRDRGFSLRVMRGGRNSLDKAVTYQPDVILLDVSMPGMDGHSVCRLLKSDPRTVDIPVIFLTGRDGVTDKLEGFEAGASDYVTKPFLADELVARIHVHWQLHRRLKNRVGLSPEEPLIQSRYDRTLQQVQTILRENMAEPPPLMELARMAGTNERSLTQLFRSRLGMPVFAWLREERHRKACSLLLETGYDMTQIATAIGYANASAFATAFRELAGMTPSAFRRSAGLVENQG